MAKIRVKPKVLLILSKSLEKRQFFPVDSTISIHDDQGGKGILIQVAQHPLCDVVLIKQRKDGKETKIGHKRFVMPMKMLEVI